MPPAHQPQRLLLGILFIIGAGLIFPVMNGIAKFLGGEYASLQVSWARAFGHVLFLLIAFMPRRGLRLLHTRNLKGQMLRSVFLFLSNLCFFFGVTFIPIGKASAISLAAPLVVALLAWPLLRERTTPGRIAALAVGFIGVIVVIRPGTSLFHWASLFILASATCYGIYQILTRRMATTDSPETAAVYSSVVGAFLIIVTLPFVWRTPDNLHDILLFCAMGPLGALGHYCVARAMLYAPANVVSPFQYFQLLGSVAVGYVAFSDLPDALTWVGAAIIVSSGLYIGWSQTRSTSRPPA